MGYAIHMRSVSAVTRSKAAESDPRADDGTRQDLPKITACRQMPVNCLLQKGGSCPPNATATNACQRHLERLREDLTHARRQAESWWRRRSSGDRKNRGRSPKRGG